MFEFRNLATVLFIRATCKVGRVQVSVFYLSTYLSIYSHVRILAKLMWWYLDKVQDNNVLQWFMPFDLQ